MRVQFFFYSDHMQVGKAAAKYEQNVELVTTNRWRPAQLVMNRFQDEKKFHIDIMRVQSADLFLKI